jgi:hypothetical protein
VLLFGGAEGGMSQVYAAAHLTTRVDPRRRKHGEVEGVAAWRFKHPQS